MDFSALNQEMQNWQQDRKIKIAYWRFYQHYISYMNKIYHDELHSIKKLKVKAKIYKLKRYQKNFNVDPLLSFDLADERSYIKRNEKQV